MEIKKDLGDPAILGELGRRLTAHRIRLGRTQAQVAREAGIGKRTLERMESGESVQSTSFIRVLREMGLLENLDALVPDEGMSPMDALELDGKARRRAYAPRPADAGTAAEKGSWRWGEDR